MIDKSIEPHNRYANLYNYTEQYRSFSWEKLNKEFSWNRTGKINIIYEAIDRHAEDPKFANRFALIFDSDDRKERITYHQMKDLSSKFGNVLKKLGIKKGDRVFTFLPRSPELYITIAGSARIGAIFGSLFEGLMEKALHFRLYDSGAKVVVTNSSLIKRIPFDELPELKWVIIVDSNPKKLKSNELSWEKEMAAASYELEPEWVDINHPLYIIYTAGSTGIPKGVVHAHRDMKGYLITGKWGLDLRKNDTLWTTADPSWIAGLVYGAYTPWICGTNNFIQAGRFNALKWHQAIEKYKITVWYTAPTVFRLIQKEGEKAFKNVNLSTLRHILTVGEFLEPDLIYWSKYRYNIPIHDTWWMAETGMITIMNFPSMRIKPGSIGKPFPGIYAAIVDENGKELPENTLGYLALKPGWPNILTGIWGNEERYKKYFKKKLWFITGDIAYMDEDGYFFFQGRDDEIINVAGTKIGPAELETTLKSHPAVADAGVIGKPDEIAGNIIKAFIVLKKGYLPSKKIEKDIVKYMRFHLTPMAAPKEIEFRDHLPKDKNGNLIRRFLKAWDLGLPTGEEE